MFSTTELEAYLDEALPTERMVAIEGALRDDNALRDELAQINGRRDAGFHSLGEIWRLARLTCPTREHLGSYLLEAQSEEQRDYTEFHLSVVGCRWCQANLEDLKSQAAAADAANTKRRRTKYFQSSVGHLKSEE